MSVSVNVSQSSQSSQRSTSRGPKHELPDLSNKTPGYLVDLLIGIRQTMSKAKVIEGHIKEVLKSKCQIPEVPPMSMEDYTKVTSPIRGETLTQQSIVPEYVTQSRFSQEKASLLLTPEQYQSCFDTITFIQLKVKSSS